ncbi:MAG TPA: DNA mismatch repair endonuclease MutL [Bacteroidia bacterium]|nr:DNA mismatch repair endonuclease MutL [Bacteroidia bacterium]
MSDIIHLLPDAVANQIAAGEVIQRPASVIKELVENAVDAGADEILVIIKDAGKTLIQITDNGKGMSPTDARMSFERHATSKISEANDLFSIRTKGFRGEALASIAAIAHVELKTRQEHDTVGTLIIIEGSEVKKQEPVACAKGTSFYVKNLFYNVPARRNFLKSDSVETTHIIEEFERVALTHPEISFTLINNNNEVFKLEKSGLRQRIVGVFGKAFNEKLVPVEESTDYVKIKGFVCKPEYARKSRGEQFFFINNRYIKNAYLNHALVRAYDQLLAPDTYPSYFIYFDLPPNVIDINIHPTKTEVKFEDEKTVYAILRSTIKRSLGIYNISPTIDFDTEATVDIMPLKPGETVKAPSIRLKEGYNPFSAPGANADLKKFNTLDDWQIPDSESFRKADNDKSVHAQLNQTAFILPDETQEDLIDSSEETNETPIKKTSYQLHKTYILSHIKTGFLIIDQQSAHERILYEKYIRQMAHHQSYSQQLLFPVVLNFSAAEAELLQGILGDLHLLGFEIELMGKNAFGINGIPPELKENELQQSIDKIIDEIKQQGEIRTGKKEFLAKVLARNMSVKSGEKLSEEEMQHIIDELFSCELPYHSPSGKPTLITFTLEELAKRFKR